MKTVTNKETGEVVEYSDEEFIAKRDTLLVEWDAAKTLLDEAKEREMQLRKMVVNFIADPERDKGTENIELGNGWKAKVVKKLTYGFVKTFDGKTDKHAIEKALQEIEADGAAGELIAERLVKWTPDLSVTEYNQLPQEYKAIIDKVIVTNEGAPTLEIVAPKAAK